KNPFWPGCQRWLVGTVLAGLAVRILLEHRR
ncbi:LysE family translocator, partial [Acinetobacter baumannii]